MKSRHVDYNESDWVERYVEHKWWIIISLIVLKHLHL